jgi:hypothetical protein
VCEIETRPSRAATIHGRKKPIKVGQNKFDAILNNC